MKIDNDKVWNEIKAGTVLGFSIEAFLNAQLQMSEQKTTNADDEMVNKIKKLLGIE